jgi:hypothetical protein
MARYIFPGNYARSQDHRGQCPEKPGIIRDNIRKKLVQKILDRYFFNAVCLGTIGAVTVADIKGVLTVKAFGAPVF